MTRLTYTTGVATSLSEQFDAALEAVRGGPGRALGHRIGGREVAEGPVVDREDPARTGELASQHHAAGRDVVERAVADARRAQRDWGRGSYSERVAVLRAGADELERRLVDVAAIVTLETGKSRTEALAEVQESVDLIRVYCDHVEQGRGFVRPLGQLADNERNTSLLRPYGVFGVISPFNFPSALVINMCAAAVVAGNTAVLKPSEEAPWSALATIEALEAAGLPPGVIDVVLGGPETGRMLVDSDVDGIGFTGSAQVGRAIARTLQQGRYARPALTEMGGKNPALITATADLDKAAEGIARAAFGLSGQKCSACSRAIVHADVHDELVDKLVAFTRTLKLGDPADASSFLGPVINAEASARFRRSVERAAADGGTVAIGGGTPDAGGYYVEPTVVTGLPGDHPLARDELFMPFVTVVPAGSLDEALELANSVDYGLTAGIFSRSQEEIDTFLERMEAGVLYVNRQAGATTGAWPGVQSFCGWKSSGASGKGALGPYFVQQYMREQCHTIIDG